MKVSKELYDFIGVPFDANVRKHIKKLSSGSEKNDQGKKSIYNVVRSENFDPNHWMHEMNMITIKVGLLGLTVFRSVLLYAIIGKLRVELFLTQALHLEPTSPVSFLSIETELTELLCI